MRNSVHSLLVSHRPRLQGFTLIELLVVISIISLLAAILFPVFSRVRENARRSTCQSNLKQISIGLAQYVADNDDRMPGWGNFGNTPSPTDQFGILDAILPYTKSIQIYRCPSEKIGQTEDPDDTAYTDYVSNANLWLGKLGVNPHGIHTSTITNPEISIAFAEGPSTPPSTSIGLETCPFNVWSDIDNASLPLSYFFGTALCATTQTVQRPLASPARLRHLDGSNYAFLDGHVKWLKPVAVASGAQVTPASTATGSPGNLGPYQATFLVR